jgi:hypothetical protein
VTHLKLRSTASAALPLLVISLISFAASHLFWRIDSVIQVEGIHVYRYIVYFAAMILWYVSTCKYNKYLALAIPSILLALAILGQQTVIDSFQAIVPVSAITMGVFATLLAPASRGRGFVEFLLVLIAPALLAESRLGGSIIQLQNGIVAYEIYVITVSVVGGYFYLRYKATADLTRRDFLFRGADEEDAHIFSQRSSFVIGLVIVAATGTSALLATTTSFLTNALQQFFVGLPLHIFLIEIILGVIVVATVYHFRTSAGET